jgi:hypothetical protein
MLLALAVGGTLAAPAFAANTAGTAPPAALEPGYAKDLTEILDSVLFYEAMIYGKVSDNYSRAMRDYFLHRVSKEELYTQVAPRLADIFPPDLAASVAASMRHPAYHHRLKIEFPEWYASGEKVAPLTAEEANTLQRIDVELSGQRFPELMPKVLDLLKSTMASIRGELEIQLEMEALKTIESTQAKIATAAVTGQPVELRTIGFGPWDQIILATGNSSQKMMLAFHRYSVELDMIDFIKLTMPDNMVIKQNFDEAKSVVNKAEDALAITLRDLGGAIHDREQDIGKSDFAGDPQFRAKQDKVTASLYTFVGDLGEANRRMFSAQRQLIDFLKERKDLARVEGKIIIFDDDANAAAVNNLLDRVIDAAKEVNALIKRQSAIEDADYDKMRKALKKS